MDYSGNSNINTSTLYHLVGKTIDTVTNYSPLLLKILGNQKPWKGYQMKFPIQFQATDTGTWFTGLEKFSTTKVNDFVNMVFNPTGREEAVTLSGIELDLNKSAQVIDLAARETEKTANKLADVIAGSFYTLQTGNAFLSLLDAADDGTNTATYGGLARSTYTGIKGNYTASVGTLTLSVMGTMFNSCTHGNESPDLIITPKAVWNYYESLLTPTVRTSVTAVDLKGYAQVTRTGIVAPGAGLKGQQGFNAIFYRGVPVVADEKANAGDMYFINSRHLAFYGLPSSLPGYKPFKFTSDNIEDVYDQAPKTFGWSFSGFQVPIDQYGEVGHIILVGNLISDKPNTLGRLTGISGA